MFKKISTSTSLLLLSIIFPNTAFGHPVDEIGNVFVYDQKQTLTVSPENITLTIELVFYALEKTTVWESIDTDKNKQLSEEEKSKWMGKGSQSSYLEIAEEKYYFNPKLLNFPPHDDFFS